jgi:teichuronic acid biosynthesis glycosyltransferase TuaH
MKSLALENLVLYVDYAYTISDLLRGIFSMKDFDWKRLIGLKPRLRRISGQGSTGLYVLSLPPIVPAFFFTSYKFFRLTNRFNAALTGFFINRAISKLELKNITGFNAFQPFLGLYWKIKNLERLIYYIYDDFTNVPWFKGFVEIEEEKFVKKADMIIVTSDELKKRNEHYNKPIEVVHNGVHFNQFNNAIYLPKLNGKFIKTIGYTGTIDSRIDVDLLENVIKGLPYYRFLFIGKVFEPVIYNRLIKYINVSFEGSVAPADVPVKQAQMDVGIIPYVCNDLTAAIYPLKVNEYLAMMMPVVMTPFASLGEIDKVVYTARTAKAFKYSIESALMETNTAVKQNRYIAARKADWKVRAGELMECIDMLDPQNSLLPLAI